MMKYMSFEKIYNVLKENSKKLENLFGPKLEMLINIIYGEEL